MRIERVVDPAAVCRAGDLFDAPVAESTHHLRFAYDGEQATYRKAGPNDEAPFRLLTGDLT